MGKPAINSSIALVFGQKPEDWSGLVNGSAETDLSSLDMLLSSWDKFGFGGIVLIQGPSDWSLTTTKGASVLQRYTIPAALVVHEEEDPVKESLFSEPVKREMEEGVLVDRVIPRALNLIAERYLSRHDKTVSVHAVGRLFGQSEHMWNRFTRHGEPYRRANINRWLLSWTNETGVSIQIIEKKPGEYELSNRGSSQSVFVPYRDEVKSTAFIPFAPAGLELIGTGSLRRVYKFDDDHVLKVPRNLQGIMANRREAEMYLDEVDRHTKAGLSPKNVEFAQCELVSVGSVEDLLLMEWVDKSRHAHKRQKHLRKVDRGQFGLTRDGRTVRFDFGG